MSPAPDELTPEQIRGRLASLPELVTAPSDVAPAFTWLSEYARHPERLRPPTPLIPYLAWPRRLTMLAAAEKLGKSTLLSQGVAAFTIGGEFLGTVAGLGTVLWLCLDEPPEDLARRALQYGTDPDRLAIRLLRTGTAAELINLIRDTEATLVVIDSLAAFASGVVGDGGSAMQWQPLLDSCLVAIRTTGVGMVFVHHATKAAGTYRDSSAIGASVDCIIEMSPLEGDTTARKIRMRGRFGGAELTVRFTDGRYGLEPTTPTVAAVAGHTRTLLELLSDAEPHGLTSTTWQRSSGLPVSSFHRARRALVHDRLAILRDRLYRVTPGGELILGRGADTYHGTTNPSGGSTTRTTPYRGGTLVPPETPANPVDPDLFAPTDTYHGTTTAPTPAEEVAP